MWVVLEVNLISVIVDVVCCGWLVSILLEVVVC